ncbi:MAG: OB-fold nucleic acid binding domain-containing protein [Cumulibacter sp.]
MTSSVSTNSRHNAKPRSFIAKLLRRITSDDDELDAEVLALNSARQGACSCSRAEPGERVLAAGRLRSVIYTPSENAPALTAELYDGSGALQLVWLGRRRIPGIEPGRSVKVQGRVALRDGERTIYNPWYELQRG